MSGHFHPFSPFLSFSFSSFVADHVIYVEARIQHTLGEGCRKNMSIKSIQLLFINAIKSTAGVPLSNIICPGVHRKVHGVKSAILFLITVVYSIRLYTRLSYD